MRLDIETCLFHAAHIARLTLYILLLWVVWDVILAGLSIAARKSPTDVAVAACLDRNGVPLQNANGHLDDCAFVGGGVR